MVAMAAQLASGRGSQILDLIGNTALLPFPALSPGHAAIYAKAEFANPGGSVKDRAAKSMIQAGLRSGALAPGKTLIDATSGNTGIAYAMLGAALGFPVTLALPGNASMERKQILNAYGAQLLLTDPGEGTDGAQRRVKEIVAREPEVYFYPDQYNNAENWRAHYRTTAEEIWQQTSRGVTHFVAALGTTGTFVGTTRRLRELNPGLTAVAVQPDAPLHGLEGVKHLPTALVPGIYDPGLADAVVEIDTDEAHQMLFHLARDHGLLVGPSSAANLLAAQKVAKGAAEGSVVVTVLCDSALRYLSDPFWDDAPKRHPHPPEYNL